MNFAEVIEELQSLRSVPVALDSLVTRPAEGMKEEFLRSTAVGFLALDEGEPASDRPVDEAAWWSRRRSGRAIFRLDPDGGGILMWPDKFRGARWEDEALVIDVGAFRHRITRLGRPSGAALSGPEI